jgi:putative ABC transport system permease protein
LAGLYKDDKPENFFAQFGTDPDEFPKVYPEMQIASRPTGRLAARPCRRDRERQLAKNMVGKLGDRIVLQGTIYPVNLEFMFAASFTWPTTNKTVYFNAKYVEEAVSMVQGRRRAPLAFMRRQPGTCQNRQCRGRYVSQLAAANQDRKRKGLWPELREHAGQREGFHSQHLLAVVFTTLLVSANTMAMSIRERTREVAVLKTLGLSGRPFLLCLWAKPCRSRRCGRILAAASRGSY